MLFSFSVPRFARVAALFLSGPRKLIALAAFGLAT